MQRRDHIIAAALALGVMALSLTVGRGPDTAAEAEHRDAPAAAETAVRR